MLIPVIMTSDVMDRRRRPRLRLSYSVRLQRPGEISLTETTTEDISCEGFFCVTDRPFAPCETLECELLIPGQMPRRTLDYNMVLRCHAEVVRVVAQTDKPGFGVACRVSDYTVGPQFLEDDMALEYTA